MLVDTVAHRSSVLCRETLGHNVCTNGICYTGATIMLCANTLVGGDPALPWSKPAGGAAATMHGSWMALRQGEACHVALLWCALAYAIWVMCISANPRSASLLVLRRSLPPMLLRRVGCPFWRGVDTALSATLVRHASWVRRRIWWWLCMGAGRRVQSLPLL